MHCSAALELADVDGGILVGSDAWEIRERQRSQSKLAHGRIGQMTDREKKKLNEKTRKQLEQAARLKAEALAETEDDAFDVNFESQGGGGDVVSATDIKARLPPAHMPPFYSTSRELPTLLSWIKGFQ